MPLQVSQCFLLLFWFSEKHGIDILTPINSTCLLDFMTMSLFVQSPRLEQ